MSNTPENKSGMPPQIDVGKTRSGGFTLSLTNPPEFALREPVRADVQMAATYIRADVAAASCAAKMEKLRKAIDAKLTHSEFARADSAADNARHVHRIDAFREVLSILDAAEGKAPEGGGT